MTENELMEYARFVIRDHGKDVEYISLFELFDEYAPDGVELGEEDAERVLDLINQAVVEVSW
ncbi:hypothetical protein EF847_01435 [Actinobacteria bacterium YIM 96077]|uniref:Uncharacterized protein n=1 Tax=Phytoactinopolyspora halophila TaxID=1981511 RepID=A0A329QHC4_9ACTN|nr:hypothetical protein [Phytoactinopolyspora halophila]AYY11583.1 hypothetical protein EF847_01435 [Actinobacteria bacterium YIM 96077]RAW11129.1 hypothetical protein DPM12_17460 [Phytoactinopolyspora halophila]